MEIFKGRKKILVTGASGFVGGHLAIGLIKLGHDVYAVGNTNKCVEQINKSAKEVFSLDLTNKQETEDLVLKIKPHFLIHAAALTDVASCQNDPRKAFLANVNSTKNLILAFEKNNFQGEGFFQISTDLVFDGKGELSESGLRENETPCPRSIYAQTKREAEILVLNQRQCGYVLRVCLVYGSALGEKEGFLGWLRGGLERKEKIRLFCDEWRTPIYIGDIIRAVDKLIGKAKEVREKGNKILHLAGATRISRYDFGLKFCKVFGFDPTLLIKALREDFSSPVKRPADVSLNSVTTEDFLEHKFLTVDQGLTLLSSLYS